MSAPAPAPLKRTPLFSLHRELGANMVDFGGWEMPVQYAQEEEGGIRVNPEELHYTQSHEWVRIDGEIGTIGITDHAQKELGEIVYLELPENGHVYNADEEFGTVESVKAVSELYTPVSGEVVDINKGAVAEPGIVNDDPYGDGWLIKLKLSADEEIGKLMSADQYAEYVKSEEKAK